MRKIIVGMLILCLVCLCGIAMADTLQLDPTITSGEVMVTFNAEGVPDTDQDCYVIDYDETCEFDSLYQEGVIRFSLHKGWHLNAPDVDLVIYVTPNQYHDHEYERENDEYEIETYTERHGLLTSESGKTMCYSGQFGSHLIACRRVEENYHSPVI